MFLRCYDDNDNLIRRGTSDYWDVARIPGIDESMVLWVNNEPVSYIVEDVLTECDAKGNVTYSANLASITSLRTGEKDSDNGD